MNTNNFITAFTLKIDYLFSCKAVNGNLCYYVASFTIVICNFFFYYYSLFLIKLSNFVKPYLFNGFLLLLPLKEKTKPRLREDAGYFKIKSISDFKTILILLLHYNLSCYFMINFFNL